MKQLRINVFVDRVMYFIMGQYTLQENQVELYIDIVQVEGSQFNIVNHLKDQTLKKIHQVVKVNILNFKTK